MKDSKRSVAEILQERIDVMVCRLDDLSAEEIERLSVMEIHMKKLIVEVCQMM